VRGLGIASHTVALQAPHLRPYLPEIDGYVKGTINLRLESPLAVVTPDVVTPPLVWLPSVPPEIFSLVRVLLEPHGPRPSAPVPGHLYQAHLSPHLADPWLAEFLAPPLPLEGVVAMTVHFPRPPREIPFLVV
jgi:hypothetical protein